MHFLISLTHLSLMCHNNLLNYNVKALRRAEPLDGGIQITTLPLTLHVPSTPNLHSIRDRKLDKKLSTYKSAILQALASLHRLTSSSDAL